WLVGNSPEMAVSDKSRNGSVSGCGKVRLLFPRDHLLCRCWIFTVMTENFGKIKNLPNGRKPENPGLSAASRDVGPQGAQNAQKSEMDFRLDLCSASQPGKRCFSMTKIIVQSCSPSSAVL